MRKHTRHLVMESLETRAMLDGDDTLAEAINLGTLVRSATVGGQIDSATDVDLYKIFIKSGMTVGFDIDTPENGRPGLGSYLRLFDADGLELAANNDAAAPGESVVGFDAYVSVPIGRDGFYYAGVSNWLNTAYDPISGDGDFAGDRHLTGSYSLTISTDQTDNILRIRNPNAVVAGTRGQFRDGVFAPDGADTRSQDARTSQGRWTSAQERRFQRTYLAFLRGRSRENRLAGTPTPAEVRAIMNPFAARFLAGTGGLWTHRPDSYLASQVKASAVFRGYHDALRANLEQQVSDQASRGVVDFSALNLGAYLNANTIHYPALMRTIPFGLRAALGGTQAIRATVQVSAVNAQVNQEGGGSLAYQATIVYEIFDVYGVGSEDRSSPALKAMWQLQHRGPRAKPFHNQVIVGETVSSSVAIPSRFNAHEVV